MVILYYGYITTLRLCCNITVMLQHYGFVATKGINCCNIATSEIQLRGTSLGVMLNIYGFFFKIFLMILSLARVL